MRNLPRVSYVKGINNDETTDYHNSNNFDIDIHHNQGSLMIC